MEEEIAVVVVVAVVGLRGLMSGMGVMESLSRDLAAAEIRVAFVMLLPSMALYSTARPIAAPRVGIGRRKDVH